MPQYVYIYITLYRNVGNFFIQYGHTNVSYISIHSGSSQLVGVRGFLYNAGLLVPVPNIMPVLTLGTDGRLLILAKCGSSVLRA